MDRHVCGGCGKPQPLAAGEDYFAALGTERRFAQDRALLEKRFYEISRALHPDRFTRADAPTRMASLERMSFVNQAYRTLRDPEALRAYVLELEGLKSPAGQKAGGGAQVPAELAESWFELQDALMESPDTARAKLADFEGELRSLQQSASRSLAETETAIDAAGGPDRARALLERLGREIQAQSYLRSMERDVERIRTRIA